MCVTASREAAKYSILFYFFDLLKKTYESEEVKLWDFSLGTSMYGFCISISHRWQPSSGVVRNAIRHHHHLLHRLPPSPAYLIPKFFLPFFGSQIADTFFYFSFIVFHSVQMIIRFENSSSVCKLDMV